MSILFTPSCFLRLFNYDHNDDEQSDIEVGILIQGSELSNELFIHKQQQQHQIKAVISITRNCHQYHFTQHNVDDWNFKSSSMLSTKNHLIHLKIDQLYRNETICMHEMRLLPSLCRSSTARNYVVRRQLPGLETKRRVMKTLYLDYDSTITEKGTVSAQLDFAVETMKKRLEPSLLQSQLAEVDRILVDVEADQKVFTEKCLSFQRDGMDERSLVDQILNEMGHYELKWNSIVEDRSILKGFTEQELLEKARLIELRTNCIPVMERCIKEGIKIKIVSANWSRNWIKESITSKSQICRSVANNNTCSKIEVVANEFQYSDKDALSTGMIEKYKSYFLWPLYRNCRYVETANDKGAVMENFLKAEDASNSISIFLGDSLLDLRALLLADVGIIIGKNKNLRKILDLCRISLAPLKTTTLSQQTRHNLVYPSSNNSLPLLYEVTNWQEIEDFLFQSSCAESNVPRVLVIAGSDSGGGAGIQADLKTCLATGAFATTVVTAITSQNTQGVQSVHPVPLDHVQSQLDSILSDIGTDVIKTGMLASAEIVQMIGAALKEREMFHLVVDPVMVSTSGHSLAGKQIVDAMKEHLFPICTVLCPNLFEAETLTGYSITNLNEMKKAAKDIHSMGPTVVLIKGGHFQNKDPSMMVDLVYNGQEMVEIVHPTIQMNRLHGTGCTLASAIASYIAQGQSPTAAIHLGIRFLQKALESSISMQLGSGKQLPFNHGYLLHQWPLYKRKKFDLSLYGIIDRHLNLKHQRSLKDAVTQAIEGGVMILQVREKNISTREFVQTVEDVIRIAKPYQVPVLVNDRVDIAIATNADGVHLGQEDLPIENVHQMLGTEKILGISVKTREQALKAKSAGADYLGVGAIYPSSSKDSTVIGLEGLLAVKNAVDLPIVAIGGISSSNAEQIIKTGADGLALISGIFDHSDVKLAASDLKHIIDSARSALSFSDVV